MFFIFSKDKIISYIVSFSTVVILLGIAFIAKDKTNTVEVSSNKVNTGSFDNNTDCDNKKNIINTENMNNDIKKDE